MHIFHIYQAKGKILDKSEIQYCTIEDGLEISIKMIQLDFEIIDIIFEVDSNRI